LKVLNEDYNKKNIINGSAILMWIKRLISSLFIFIGGWLFNFIFDIQFALGITAGWLMREGYENIALGLLNLLS
jgi:hypothetical protein